MKNILMLTTQLSMGGAEKVFYDHLMAFSEKYNVKVCLFTKKGINKNFVFSNELFELDDKIISNPVKRWKYRRNKLRNIITKNKIDVCISHMEGPNFLNAVAGAGCKKIFVAHGSIQNNSQKSFLNKTLTNKLLIPFLYKKADTVVTVSHGIAKEHKDTGLDPAKVITINNFFSVADISERSLEPTPMDDFFSHHKVLVHVGRMAPEKNQQFLLHLLKYLRDAGRTEKLVLVGDGALREQLTSEAKRIGLKTFVLGAGKGSEIGVDVVFTGSQSNPYAFVARSSAFLLCSFNEGFPLVLGESLACGIPVVSVDCPTGPREILTKPGEIFQGHVKGYDQLFCGTLVQYFPDEGITNEYLGIWKKAIADLLDDNKGRDISSNCREKAQQFDKTIVVTQWDELINNLYSHPI